MASEPDTIYVNVRIDEDPSSVSSQSKTQSLLIVVLIALCIIGIILAVLLMVLGKKFKKNKRSTVAGSTTATKSVVRTDISPRTRYEPVCHL